MAGKRSETTPAEEATASEEAGAPTVAASDRSYSIERLIADSDGFFGVPNYVAAGGLHGCTGEMTVADAKARIDKWLATPAA